MQAVPAPAPAPAALARVVAGAPARAWAGAGVVAGAAAAAVAVPDLFGSALLPQRRMRVPQQDNDFDCGLFLLTFIERFTTKIPEVTAAVIAAAVNDDLQPTGSMLPEGFLRREWFVPEVAAMQRSRITLLILEQLLAAQLDLGAAEEGAAETVVTAQQGNRAHVVEELGRIIQEVGALVGQRQLAVDAAEARARWRL